MNDDNLKSAEVETAKWRSRVERINAKIREAQDVLSKSDTRRAEHALAAATGDETAAGAMTKIRRENENAERDIADLRLALPEAQRHLAAAEQVESNLRKSASRKVAREKMALRIQAAKKFDAALVELVRALNEWIELGGEIEQYYLEIFGGAASLQHITDNVNGMKRVIAALPPSIFGRLFPTTPLGLHSSLERSEADLWNLPAETTSTAA
jgi:chromosome segregation ATPase